MLHVYVCMYVCMYVYDSIRVSMFVNMCSIVVLAGCIILVIYIHITHVYMYAVLYGVCINLIIFTILILTQALLPYTPQLYVPLLLTPYPLDGRAASRILREC